MAFAQLSKTEAQGGSNVSTSAINTTGASLIVVTFTGNNAFTEAISDSAGNTWVQSSWYGEQNGNNGTSMAWCINPTTSASHTFSSNAGTNTFGWMTVSAWSSDSTPSLKQSNLGSQTVGASITPLLDDCLVIGIGYELNGAGYTSDNDTVIYANNITNQQDHGGIASYSIQTTAATETLAFSTTSGSGWAYSSQTISFAEDNEIATDDFNRANEQLSTSSNWGNSNTPNDYPQYIVSNEVQDNRGSSVGTDAPAFWVGDTFDDDQWAEVTGTLTTTGSQEVYAIVRAQSPAATMYVGVWSTGGSYVIYEVTNGSWQIVGTSSTGHATSGTKTLRLEAVGTTLTLYVDGNEELVRSDATLTGGSPGMGTYRNSNTGSDRSVLDNFSAGDWTTPAAGPAPVLSLVSKDADQIDLSWTASPGATGYDIERNGTVIVYDHPTTSYSDTGLDPSTEYTHRVGAVNAGGA